MEYGRFECHAHTHYSNLRLLDSINTPRKLVDHAKQIGLRGICVTDHEALGGHVELDQIQQELIENNDDFKIGLGNEIYLTDTRDMGQKYYHFILIAKNATGHKMLRELSSVSWMNSYFDRRMERVPTLKSELESVIQKYGKGNLIASSACLGSELDWDILQLVDADKCGNIEKRREYYGKIDSFIRWCVSLFDDDFYLEVQPARSEEQLAVNSKMGQIAKCYGLKIIVTTDAHYLRKKDRHIHEAYLNSKGGERETAEFYSYAYLQTTEEVKKNLEGTGLDYSELERNTWEIYDKIERYTFHKKQKVPQVDVPDYPKRKVDSPYPTLNLLYDSDNPQERYWINYCVDELKKRDLYNDTYLSRLEEEADIQKVIGDKLETCMFSYPIFLQHYIDLMWECGSTIGAGRGSACSGLNHWLLGVTQLDPVKWDLPYFRYLNKERVEIGDIDIDICPSKRELIFDKIREERGKLGCVQVCTYGTETTKSAIKTACRGYRSKEYPEGIDVDIAEYLSSLIPSERGFLWDIHDVAYGNEEKDRKPVRAFLNEIAKYPGLLDIIENIEGLICRRGIHASGVNFYGEDPFETACFMKAKNGAITTQYSLHHTEYCSDVKFDFLVTEVEDIIAQCIGLLQKYNKIDSDLTLRQAYDRYLAPEKLPIDDDKLWKACISGKVQKLFQFTSQVGSQTIKLLKPHTPLEMSLCNGIMRLMPTEKGGETPTQRYHYMKTHPGAWEKEMSSYGLCEEEQKTIKKYVSNGTLVDQESLMLILMDENVCGFTLAESNTARKTVAKKMMDKIEELHQKILSRAASPAMGKYVWFLLAPSMGYSFSRIHGLAYSFVGLQTAYLATYFPSVYWNTACLRIDSGLDEDASANYGKIAKAVGAMRAEGINVSLTDINKSEYMFEPDEKNNTIIYGLKGQNGLGGEIIQEIIENRPYASWQDFLKKTPVNKTVMISLIKSGAFDSFDEREQIMEEYIDSVSDKKSKLTLSNFNMLLERNLVPLELSFQKRVFVYNKALKANCKDGDVFAMKADNYYKFFSDNFDVDLLIPHGNTVAISIKEWKKIYDKAMLPAKEWLAENQEALLEQVNRTSFAENWDKYASGSYSTWEMDSLGMYYHEHELANVDFKRYNIVEFANLPRDPEIDRTFTRKGRTYHTYKTCRITGTVIAKDDMHSSISLLTVGSGVVTVKMNRDVFARYNRRISDVSKNGKKTVREIGWFQKGTLLVVNGFRREDTFVAKAYKRKNCPQVHQICKILSIGDDGSLHMTNLRYGEEDD